jgi:predicted Fe-Mo cluster-binding NifX family protein
MKVAVTSRGDQLDSQVDPRFGRAEYILIVDTENFDFKVVNNTENKNAFKGAGIKAATSVSDNDAEVLLTGYCGPNAFTTLAAAGIKVVNDVEGTIKEAVESFNAGKFTYADSANKDGHW